ncbi:2-amino-4-hydroxy-6-hydroxymethyldihydropteridine diphosphokinase [Mitsuokella jalaludinii]|uniref:2-amino-4-hydroxy-6- hydroxymethyldihydropteridine diphosphokinase n=1 Tax=Mitsuokella jalaludinii TaxID=187979 RepID=UPI003F989D80
MKYRCYLSLGANLGARGETLREALRRLAAFPDTMLTAISPFYETAPWGKLDQPSFLNTAAAITTNLAPHDLLHACQAVEHALGRVRHEHWGARTIDIDLLAIEGVTSEDAELRLPHPYMTERAFVLVPLADIAPGYVVKGRSIREWCVNVGREGVVRSAELADPWPLRLLACIDANRGLGKDGQLLVSIPEDMARFRHLTMGHVVIMGRRTMESLPGNRPLPGRTNIVLSRTLSTASAEGFLLCRDIQSLWDIIGKLSWENPECLFWCIGGAAVYQELLPYVKEAYLTELTDAYPADCYLPSLASAVQIERECYPGYAFCRYLFPQRATVLAGT